MSGPEIKQETLSAMDLNEWCQFAFIEVQKLVSAVQSHSPKMRELDDDVTWRVDLVDQLELVIARDNVCLARILVSHSLPGTNSSKD